MSTADELRRAFDASFAAAIADRASSDEDVLSIAIAGRPYALRLSEIAGLFAGRTIVRVPSRHPEQLGLAGFRGAIVPVFDLAALLELPRASSPRWIVIAARSRVGLAFDALEGHRRIAPGDIAASNEQAGPEVVRDGDRLIPIVRLASVLARIERKET